eukprot:g4444.t1
MEVEEEVRTEYNEDGIVGVDTFEQPIDFDYNYSNIFLPDPVACMAGLALQGNHPRPRRFKPNETLQFCSSMRSRTWSTEELLDFICESGCGLGLSIDKWLPKDTLCVLFNLFLRMQRAHIGSVGGDELTVPRWLSKNANARLKKIGSMLENMGFSLVADVPQEDKLGNVMEGVSRGEALTTPPLLFLERWFSAYAIAVQNFFDNADGRNIFVHFQDGKTAKTIDGTLSKYPLKTIERAKQASRLMLLDETSIKVRVGYSTFSPSSYESFNDAKAAKSMTEEESAAATDLIYTFLMDNLGYEEDDPFVEKFLTFALQEGNPITQVDEVNAVYNRYMDVQEASAAPNAVVATSTSAPSVKKGKWVSYFLLERAATVASIRLRAAQGPSVIAVQNDLNKICAHFNFLFDNAHEVPEYRPLQRSDILLLALGTDQLTDSTIFNLDFTGPRWSHVEEEEGKSVRLTSIRYLSDMVTGSGTEASSKEFGRRARDGLPWILKLKVLCARRLSVTGHGLSEISDLSMYKSLRVLRADNNEITRVKLEHMNSLQLLDLSKNDLGVKSRSVTTKNSKKEIEMNLRMNLPALRTLNLSGNNLKGPLKPLLGGVPNLTSLDISKNKYNWSKNEATLAAASLRLHCPELQHLFTHDNPFYTSSSSMDAFFTGIEVHLPDLLTIDGENAAQAESEAKKSGGSVIHSCFSSSFAHESVPALDRYFERQLSQASSNEERLQIMGRRLTLSLRQAHAEIVSRCSALMNPRSAFQSLYNCVRRINLKRAFFQLKNYESRTRKLMLRLWFWAFRISCDNAKINATRVQLKSWRHNTSKRALYQAYEVVIPSSIETQALTTGFSARGEIVVKRITSYHPQSLYDVRKRRARVEGGGKNEKGEQVSEQLYHRVRPGDVLTHINGFPLSNNKALEEQVAGITEAAMKEQVERRTKSNFDVKELPIPLHLRFERLREPDPKDQSELHLFLARSRSSDHRVKARGWSRAYLSEAQIIFYYVAWLLLSCSNENQSSDVFAVEETLAFNDVFYSRLASFCARQHYVQVASAWSQWRRFHIKERLESTMQATRWLEALAKYKERLVVTGEAKFKETVQLLSDDLRSRVAQPEMIKAEAMQKAVVVVEAEAELWRLKAEELNARALGILAREKGFLPSTVISREPIVVAENENEKGAEEKKGSE